MAPAAWAASSPRPRPETARSPTPAAPKLVSVSSGPAFRGDLSLVRRDHHAAAIRDCGAQDLSIGGIADSHDLAPASGSLRLPFHRQAHAAAADFHLHALAPPHARRRLPPPPL